MSPSPWNQPLPPALTLGGEKGLNDPLLHPTQSWVVTGGSPNLGIHSQIDDLPGEIVLQTSYWEGSQASSVPKDFPLPPILAYMSWDWLTYYCQPFPDLEVEVINWVPDPRVICGVHRLQNKSTKSREITFKLTCLDQPGLLGTRFSQESYQGRRILSGSSKYTNLVLFLSGNIFRSSGPTNQLASPVALKPAEKAETHWVLIFCESDSDARSYLQEVIQLDWPGELSRRKVSLANQLQVNTGNPDWDFSIACSQRLAQVLFQQLILQAEKPDSSLPDLNTFQVWQLTQALTPLEAGKLEWLLENTIPVKHNQEPNFPIQVELLSQALSYGLDQDLVSELLLDAEKNLISWFSPSNDKDQDGIPENPEQDIFQTGQHHGMLDNKDDLWGIPAGLESPALAALLLNELRQLQIVQKNLPQESFKPEHDSRMKILEDFIRSSWFDHEGRFQPQDFQTHTSEKGYTLPVRIMNGWNNLQCELPYPSQLILQLAGSDSHSQLTKLQVIFHGLDWQERYRIEVLNAQELVWQGNNYRGITKSIFKRLDHCVVSGINKHQEFQIKMPGSDRYDLSLILPLWMEDLPPEIGQKLLHHWLTDPTHFWSEFGLKTDALKEKSLVQLPLNTLIMAGMIKKDYGPLAANLFKHWLEAVSLNLKRTGSLYAAWEAQKGNGLGKVNRIESLLPIGLLLELLGVQIHLAGDVVLKDRTPLIFPVKLYFKGIELVLEEKKTVLLRPGRAPKTHSREKKAHLRI